MRCVRARCAPHTSPPSICRSLQAQRSDCKARYRATKSKYQHFISWQSDVYRFTGLNVFCSRTYGTGSIHPKARFVPYLGWRRLETLGRHDTGCKRKPPAFRPGVSQQPTPCMSDGLVAVGPEDPVAVPCRVERLHGGRRKTGCCWVVGAGERGAGRACDHDARSRHCWA